MKINKLINRSLLPPDLRFSVLAAVLILAGCSTAPDNTLSHIKRADELASSQSLTTAKEGRWPDAQWWLRYHDRQLDSLMETALASAPTGFVE